MNYVKGFRFSDGYEDVFVEDAHLLYVCAEPYTYTGFIASRPYRLNNSPKYIVCGDTAPCDANYALALEQAPADIAAKVIYAEFFSAARTALEDADGVGMTESIELARDAAMQHLAANGLSI